MCPIVDDEPIYPVIPDQPAVVVTRKPKYEGINVDTKHIDASNLLTHVEGSSWSVNYYSQVLTKDMPLSGQTLSRSAVHQQYVKIGDLEIKVTSPIVYTQDDATKSIKGTGTGNLYPFVIPNVGDLFTADLGDGTAGLFRITVSERKTIFKNTVHTVEYILVETSANELSFQQRLDDLNSKVVERVVYVRDFLAHGQNPILQLEEYEVLAHLSTYYFNIMHRYFKSFVSNEYKTVLIPGQPAPTYDHFLTKAIMSFFTTYDSPEIRNIKILNVDDDEIMKSTNIWDMLKLKDDKMFKYCFKRAGLVTAMSYTKNPMLEGIYHSGIKLVVYPIDPQVSVDGDICRVTKPIYENALKDTPPPIRDLNDLINENSSEGLTLPDTPLIHNVTTDDYYVLSEAFYKKDDINMSALEICVFDYLRGKAPNTRVLLDLCKTAHAWNRLEQYYYTIILLVLLKGAVRNM